MQTIALIVFFLLFAAMNLIETKIPNWVLGVTALLVAITLIVSSSWKKSA